MKRIIFAMMAALLLNACVYITGADSDSPEPIELSDVQGCYYSARELSGFYSEYQRNGWQVKAEDRISQRIECRKICIDGNKATDLTFYKKIFWSLDTTQILSVANTDSVLAKGQAYIIYYDENDGHFVNNLRLTFSYPFENADDEYYSESHKYIFAEEGGTRGIYKDDKLVVASGEYEKCKE